MDIATKTLESWGQIHDYDKRVWIYRGQRSVNWPIKTSIERFFDREDIPPTRRDMLEQELIRDFKRAYHQYSIHLPREEALIEWLSLMQHHGAPTRFADFTYSIYVAAYFALEAASEDCALWCINGNWAVEQSIRALKEAGKETKLLSDPTVSDQEPIAVNALLKGSAVPCAMPLNPFRLNERLRIQKGIFVVPGNLAAGFMQNLQALPDYESAEYLVKIIIPIGLRKQALQQLFYMNISRTSLFPGLDGYAQSLGVYHPSFNPENWRERAYDKR